ncbi:peptidoglycan-associated lipoprotein Pal [Bordetella sp. FB-8]|uniref:peptidoglycan-associated lipoprotein Pal n=1 Tax=Bordetella sp. FB-8 TaxID=1159870 RepID=UPI00036EB710|nr:peptidoglycan-associated lipoprotein Pal [Bordetella sp. FB-8]
MKSRIAKSLSIAALTAALAACSSVPLDKNAGGASNGSTGDVMDPFNPSSVLYQQRSVYFGFDQYNVDDQYRNLVSEHAHYLAAHPQQHVKIEGNTDERGGAEYNLALGQRRAEAVAKLMELQGVNSSQIETISFGKEKPKAMGHTEADWAQNRRADIDYLR